MSSTPDDTEVRDRVDPIDWLLAGDPAIRWQVMRDLLDAPPAEVAIERARVAREGLGAAILEAQRDDGSWGGGANFPEWTGTKPTLVVLRLLGPDPADPRVRAAVARASVVRWEYDPTLRFWGGEVEPCINGALVAVGTAFGQDMTPVVDRLLGEQMADGGWNCEQENGSTRGSFDTTINVLEGLLAWEHVNADEPRNEVTDARRRGEAYLLDRHLLRRQSTGELVDPAYLELVFPPRWHYDVLRALDHLRQAGVDPADPRLTEALDLLERARDPDGRWTMTAEYPGEVEVAVDDGVGRPSRWITLRALRVLRWAGRPSLEERP